LATWERGYRAFLDELWVSLIEPRGIRIDSAMTDVSEPESPKAGMSQIRAWGSLLLGASVLLLIFGRRTQAIGFGIVGALLTVGSLTGARLGLKKPSVPARVALVGASCLVALGSMVAHDTYRERQKAVNAAGTQAPTAKPSAAALSVERRCRIRQGKTESVVLEGDGGAIHVERGAHCVVLNVDPSRMLIRVTDGPSAGAVGWLASGDIGLAGE
jgi:hypothetical protein